VRPAVRSRQGKSDIDAIEAARAVQSGRATGVAKTGDGIVEDFTHFVAACRVAYAVMDVVSRRWLRTLVTTEESATQVEVLFTGALDDEGLWGRIEARQAGSPLAGDDPDVPILLAMSDNGPQMRAGTTREFLALCSIVAHFGRPGTPTDQAWIETLFGHVKGEWPHLEKIRDPAVLAGELEIVRADYNGRRLHAGIGYVTPDDEHAGRGEQIRQARRDGLARARAARLAYHRNTKPGTQP
jgi:transposase InsO family protein